MRIEMMVINRGGWEKGEEGKEKEKEKKREGEKRNQMMK